VRLSSPHCPLGGPQRPSGAPCRTLGDSRIRWAALRVSRPFGGSDRSQGSRAASNLLRGADRGNRKRFRKPARRSPASPDHPNLATVPGQDEHDATIPRLPHSARGEKRAEPAGEAAGGSAAQRERGPAAPPTAAGFPCTVGWPEWTAPWKPRTQPLALIRSCSSPGRPPTSRAHGGAAR
jgi:hypothetical protein